MRVSTTILAAGVFAVTLPTARVEGQTADFVRSSDRRSNDIIAELIVSGDFGTASETSKVLVEREDQFVADIVIEVLENITARNAYILEYMLRLILMSVSGAPVLNIDAIRALAEAADSFEDPVLRGDILVLIAGSGERELESAVLQAGKRIVTSLNNGNGTVTGEEAYEIDAYFRCGRVFPSAAFKAQAAAVVSLARDRRVIAIGRSILKEFP